MNKEGSPAPLQQPTSFNLTADDLKSIISAAVASAVIEAKRPYISEQEQRKLENDQRMRLETAEQVRQGIENRLAMQKRHRHIRREDGKTQMVYIENGHYLICQECQAVVRPGVAPENYKGRDIYNDQLFYDHLQMSQPVSFA